MVKRTKEQLEERFSEWLDKDVLSFYKSNIKNPEIVGKEMRFPFDEGLNLTLDDVDCIFSSWLDEIYEDQFENFNQSWAEDYEAVSLEAFDIKLRDEDIANLKEAGYKNLSNYRYDCVLKVVTPTYDVCDNGVLVRFEIDFVAVEYYEPSYDEMYGSYEFDYINEEQYKKIKEALDELDYLDKPYKDRYYVCSDWETPCFDDPEITKEHVTENYAGVDPDDYDDEEDGCHDEIDNESILEDIRDTIMRWFLDFDVDDKCSKIRKNLKYLKEDEVLKLEILSGEGFVLDCDEVDYIFEDCYEEWWDRHWDNELGVKEFSEGISACKNLNRPELDYEYDKENKMLTIRATFSVYYSGHLYDDEMDKDYAEECYESGNYPPTSSDDEYDDGCWWDGYPSEEAFWECNGI